MRCSVRCLLLFAIVSIVFSLGCGDLKKAKGDSEDVYQEYGKPGSTNGESCYVGPAKKSHTCTDVMSGDTDGLKSLNLYCRKFGGQRARGSCKKENLVGTCRYMKDAPTFKMRFYDQAWYEAKAVCDEESGILDRFW